MQYTLHVLSTIHFRFIAYPNNKRLRKGAEYPAKSKANAQEARKEIVFRSATFSYLFVCLFTFPPEKGITAPPPRALPTASVSNNDFLSRRAQVFPEA